MEIPYTVWANPTHNMFGQIKMEILWYNSRVRSFTRKICYIGMDIEISTFWLIWDDCKDANDCK